MTSTFYLKSPNSNKESLILFSCYFKYEGKKFVYSTGEKIHSNQWDFDNRQPFKRGKNKSKQSSSISLQLGRYLDCFKTTQANCSTTKEEFTSLILKKAFDEEFKKAPSGKNLFYDAFDEFVEYKTKNIDWSPSTIKRYKNIKNILQNFEESRKYKINFNSINDSFHAEFTDYCMNELNHINNTYSRNLGLIKTFLFWAAEKKYTYNIAFKKFKKKKRVVTKQIALGISDLEKLMDLTFETERLEKVRDIFVFSCVTGLRYGELKYINKENVTQNSINLKEEKESSKEDRLIPLNDLSTFVLNKYDFNLPIIANQKYNEYLKEVFEFADYTYPVEKITTKGKEVIRETMLFKDRISSHTARRTFITMMKKKGFSDKLISKITGHKDLKTLNLYYQVDDEDKKDAVIDTFNIKFSTLKKVENV